MRTTTRRATSKQDRQPPVVLFGIGMGVFMLYMVTYKIIIHAENDWYREAWPAYQQLFHGHVVGFLQRGPAYVGSLVLRAPFALASHVFGASARTTYFICALPCLLAPGLYAGYLANNRPGTPRETGAPMAHRGLRPVDFFMATPSAIVALVGGHPEDILVSVLCVFAVLLALRGSARTAGFVLGVALINKSWAVVIVPMVLLLMPANRRVSGLVTLLITAGLVLIPVTVIRASATGGAGNALGGQASGIFLLPQLLWWFGPHAWIVGKAHFLLVLVDWVVAGAWWFLRVRGRSERPELRTVLMALALIFFLRAVLDPWDNIYYLAPFMLTILTIDDPPGFPRLSWVYTILIVLIVPPAGVLRPLGHTGHGLIFTAFALLTIGWFGRNAFARSEVPDGGRYAASAGSGAGTKVAIENS